VSGVPLFSRHTLTKCMNGCVGVVIVLCQLMIPFKMFSVLIFPLSSKHNFGNGSIIVPNWANYGV
jgi:hypothetical protein